MPRNILSEEFRRSLVHKYHYAFRKSMGRKERMMIIGEYHDRRIKRKMDWENPVTFNAKILWYKMNYQMPLMTRCCDKFAVKEYVAETIGPEYAVKTLRSWTDPRAVDFTGLPDRYVLKVNWCTGYNILVPDSKKLNERKAKRKLARWMKPSANSYWHLFNWAYKNVKPVAYAEEFLDAGGDLCDYKLFFCSGEFAFMMVASERTESGAYYAYYDKDLNLLPLKRSSHAVSEAPLPKQLEKMKELGKKLAEPFPFVRVDFYEVGDRICVGEMTFYTAGGTRPFKPEEWDEKLGAYIPLPEPVIEEEEEPSPRRRKAWRRWHRFEFAVRRLITGHR